MPKGIYKRTPEMETGKYKNHQIGKNAPNFKDGRCLKKHYCKELGCNNEISYWNFLYGKGRCKPCSSKGARNGNWINGKGYEPYTKEFTLRLRDQIRERDNYECQGQGCNITQEEHFIMYGRDLEIHHIDHDKQNCKKKNLITLCKQCNIRANFNREYWKEYFNKIIFSLV